MSLQNDSQTATNQRDELLAALTNQHCRFVVRSFRNAPEDDASVEDFSMAFARENDGDEERAALHLHHSALPKLSDLGIVDYDARTKTVRYHGHSEVDAVLDSIDSDSKQAGIVW